MKPKILSLTLRGNPVKFIQTSSGHGRNVLFGLKLMNQMKCAGIKALILLTLFCVTGKAEEVETTNPMIRHPEWYIKITDWSFYTAARVAIIHHVTIENTSDIAYKNIKVKVYYYSRSYSNYGQLISSTTGVLSITVPPHSKKTYLQGGATLGAGSMNFNADNIQVLGAIPLVE